MLCRLVGFALLASVAACRHVSRAEPDRDAPPVRTDSAVYVLRHQDDGFFARAVAAFVNRTTHRIYYAQCRGGQYLQPRYVVRRTGVDTLRPIFPQFWACVGGTPTGEVAAGDSLRLVVLLGEPEQPGSEARKPAASSLGMMRIEVLLCEAPAAESDHCQPLPQRERESNAFVVRY